MPRVVAFVAMFTVAGCATQLQIIGPYAGQLSQSDIQQITALITPSEMTSHVYTRLEAVRPDQVRVKYGGYRRSLEGVYTSDQRRSTSQRSSGTVDGLQVASLASRRRLQFTESTIRPNQSLEPICWPSQYPDLIL